LANACRDRDTNSASSRLRLTQPERRRYGARYEATAPAPATRSCSSTSATCSPRSRGLELKGFQRLSLDRGAAREVSFTLGPEELRMLDRDRRWVVEPGPFCILVGASSKDMRLRGELIVK
jgi:hypothetical protein